MCLISIKPMGKSWDTAFFIDAIRAGFEGNGDLSGFALYEYTTGRVYVDKNYKEPGEMLYTLRNMTIKDSDMLVIHHRLATDGPVNHYNCQPIIIPLMGTKSSRMMESHLSGYVDCPVLMHNGLINKYRGDRKYSDSYLFAKEFLGEKTKVWDAIRDPQKFSIEHQTMLGWSKCAILNPGMTKLSGLFLIGEEFIKDGGYMFSNNGYKYHKTYGYSGKAFNDEEDSNESFLKLLAAGGDIDETKEIETPDDYSNLTFVTEMPKEYEDKLKAYRKQLAESKDKAKKERLSKTSTDAIETINISRLMVDDSNKHFFKILNIANGMTTADETRIPGQLYEILQVAKVGTIKAVARNVYDTASREYKDVISNFYMHSLWHTQEEQALYKLLIAEKHKEWYGKVLEIIKFWGKLSKNSKKRVLKFLDDADNIRLSCNIPNYGNYEYSQISEALLQYEWLSKTLDNPGDLITVYNKKAYLKALEEDALDEPKVNQD